MEHERGVPWGYFISRRACFLTKMHDSSPQISPLGECVHGIRPWHWTTPRPRSFHRVRSSLKPSPALECARSMQRPCHPQWQSRLARRIDKLTALHFQPRSTLLCLCTGIARRAGQNCELGRCRGGLQCLPPAAFWHFRNKALCLLLSIWFLIVRGDLL